MLAGNECTNMVPKSLQASKKPQGVQCGCEVSEFTRLLLERSIRNLRKNLEKKIEDKKKERKVRKEMKKEKKKEGREGRRVGEMEDRWMNITQPVNSSINKCIFEKEGAKNQQKIEKVKIPDGNQCQMNIRKESKRESIK